jgi:hypothetical protein
VILGIGAADVQQEPLVSVELRRVSAGFRDAARELDAARQLLSAAGGLGTPAADPAVEAGLQGLADLLERLEATASTCVVALSPYDERAGQ